MKVNTMNINPQALRLYQKLQAVQKGGEEIQAAVQKQFYTNSDNFAEIASILSEKKVEKVTHTSIKAKNDIARDVPRSLATVINSVYKAEDLLERAAIGDDIGVLPLSSSLNEAQNLLDLAIGVRDKFVAAYLDILKMPL